MKTPPAAAQARRPGALSIEPIAPADDRTAQQIALEILSAEQGEARFHRQLTRLRRRGAEADGAPGRRAVDRHAIDLERAIEAHLAAPRRGRRPQSLALLRSVPARAAAFLTLRVLINAAATWPSLTDAALTLGERIDDERRLSARRAIDVKRFARLQRAADRLSGYAEKRRLFDRAFAFDAADDGSRPDTRGRELRGCA